MPNVMSEYHQLHFKGSSSHLSLETLTHFRIPLTVKAEIGKQRVRAA